MKNEHINQLINRYMQGLTTLDEEQELAQWFRSHEVDDDWKPFQQMFAWFDAGMPPQDGLLQDAQKDEKPDAEAEQAKRTEPAQRLTFKVRFRRLLWTGIAAAAVVAVVWIVWPKQQVSGVAGQSPLAQTDGTPQKRPQTKEATDTAFQSEVQSTKKDSLKKKPAAKSRYREYRRFHQSMVTSDNLLAEAATDSIMQAGQDEIADEMMRRQLASILIDQKVNNIVNYQQYCLDKALYEKEQEEETEITY